MVLGNPSNRKPLAQSAWAIRSLTKPMMMSSLTNPPESITFLAANPMGEPVFTAARSMSPVEIWGIPYFWQMKVACVPLPAPGAPNKMSLMLFSSDQLFLSAPRIARQHPTKSYGLPSKKRLTRAKSSGVSIPGPGAWSVTWTAMRWPCQSARSCSSDSSISSGAGVSWGKTRKN